MKFAKLWSGTLSRRTAALLSAALVLLGTIPAAQFAQAKMDAVTGEITLIKWERARGRADMPGNDGKWHYAMFGFENGERKEKRAIGYVAYYNNEKYNRDIYAYPISFYDWLPVLDQIGKGDTMYDTYYSLPPNYRPYDSDVVFPTADSITKTNNLKVLADYYCPLIKYVDNDDNNNDNDKVKSQRYYVRMPFSGVTGNKGTSRFVDDNKKPYFELTGVGTNGDQFKWDKDYNGNRWTIQWRDSSVARIFYNEDDGYDARWHADSDGGGKMWAKNTRRDGEATPMSIWIGTEVEFSVINKDYTIRSGQVMNVDDGVILNDGVTLTVEPGAVLSVNGRFYNNGTILNYGTVYIQANSCMMPLYSADEEYTGQVVCVGGKRTVQTADGGKATGCGDIIIDPNGKLGLTDDGRLYLQQGATLVNNGGVVLLKQQPVISNSCVINRELGHIHFGQKLEHDLLFLSTKSSGGMDELSGLSLSGATDSGMVFKNSKFVNYGTFYSNQSGFTPLVETRGAGLTFSEGDSFISGANNSYASSDTFTSAEYNEDTQLGGVAGCGS